VTTLKLYAHTLPAGQQKSTIGAQGRVRSPYMGHILYTVCAHTSCIVLSFNGFLFFEKFLPERKIFSLNIPRSKIKTGRASPRNFYFVQKLSGGNFKIVFKKIKKKGVLRFELVWCIFNGDELLFKRPTTLIRG
jgi:hypothetical protein